MESSGSAQDDELPDAVSQYGLEPVVNKSRTRDQQSGRANNLRVLRCFLIRLLESRYHGMVRQEVTFFGPEKPFRKKVRIAYIGVRFTCAKSSRSGGPD
jgi:hypothetical protein